MKRMISFFLVVLSSVILAPRAASAQTATFSDGNTFEDALKFVVKCSNGAIEDVYFDRSADAVRRAKIGYARTVTCGGMKEMITAIEKILPEGYTYHVDRGGLLHILAVTAHDGDTTASSAPAPPPPSVSPAQIQTVLPAATPTAQRPYQRLTMYDVPTTYSPALGISEAEWVLARNRMPLEPSIMAPPPVPTYGGGYGASYPQVYAAAGNYGYSSGYNAWSLKGCATGPAGYVKFSYTGKSSERKYWNVYLNGEIPGSLDQADSFFNHPIEVCAGHVVVLAEKLGLASKAQNERSFSVRPYTTTEITIGDYLFERDTHREVRNRVLIEK